MSLREPATTTLAVYIREEGPNVDTEAESFRAEAGGNTLPDVGSCQPAAAPANPPSKPTLVLPPVPTPLCISSLFPYYHDMTFTLSAAVTDEVGLSHGDKVMLAFDQTMPWCVGLSWDPTLTSSRKTPRFRRATSRSKGYWRATLRPEQVQAFFSEELEERREDDSPPRPSHEPEVTVDRAGKTIWFPLPYGRSIHLLSRYFGSFATLDSFIVDWLSLDNTVPPGLCESGDGYYRFTIGDPSRIDQDIHISIPDEILRNPIRNGSPVKAHGFNPWDPIQHLKIRDYLETEARPQVEAY